MTALAGSGINHAGNSLRNIISLNEPEKILIQRVYPGTYEETGCVVRLFHDTVNLTVPDGNHAEIGGAGVFFYQNGVFDIPDFCNRLRIDIIIAGQEQEVPGNPGFGLPECMGGAESVFPG